MASAKKGCVIVGIIGAVLIFCCGGGIGTFVFVLFQFTSGAVNAGDEFLIEERGFDRGGAPAKLGFKAGDREGTRKWFRSDFAVENSGRTVDQMDDPAELSLIGEAKILSVIKCDREVFKPQRRLF